MHFASLLIALIPAALMVFGIRMFLKARRIDFEIQRDKFNRKNSNGLMEFDSFDEARSSARRAGANGARIVIGLLLTLVGAGFFIAVLVQWNNASTRMDAKDEAQLVAACDAAWDGPMGSDLEPCRQICKKSDYKEACRKKFGWEDGPTGGPR